MLAVETQGENVPGTSRRRAIAATGRRFARWCRGSMLDLLYTAACAGCGKELATAEEMPFCAGCLGQLKLIEGASCLRCGAPVPGDVSRSPCYRCGGTKLSFDETVALGEYEGLLRDWLLQMKHGRSELLGLSIAELIWQRHAERLQSLKVDVVVPVPMHWRRRWMRGINSPAVVAERLAGHLRVPMAADLLCRTRHTRPQFSLPQSERRANVRNAFAVRAGYHLREAQVLVVDDILTTGSTCSYVSRALKEAGAQFVAVVVAARTLRH